MTRAAFLLILLLFPAAAAQETEAPAAEPTALETLHSQAQALRPLIASDFARSFLAATSQLPEVQPRTLFANEDRSHWYTAAQAGQLGEAERAALTERSFDADFYWNTRYGTPVAYARALDLVAQRGLPERAAPDRAAPDRAAVIDFGCGGLGAPRLLATLGCSVVAVDVDPLLPVLYSEPGDTGRVGPAESEGMLTLVTGHWPGEPAVADAVSAALPGGVDLFLSKNTLKRGYVHPAEEVDPRKLVHLGVSDEEFVGAVARSLRPGGLFVIYNLCPAPAPPGQPYIPWADGHCPFTREVLETAGLQVLDYDMVDDATARAMGHALGWDAGEDAMDLQADLFAWFTVARRAPTDAPK